MLRFIFLSGVATSMDFMDPLREELLARCADNGIEAAEQPFMPYGDWSRPVVAQLLEVRRDVRIKRNLTTMRSLRASVQAQQITEAIRTAYSGEKLIFIGHSAGGTIAVKIAMLLEQQEIQVSHIVQIGSPKFAIPQNLRSRVLYLYAVNASGRIADPIVRLGTWGGWYRANNGIPAWSRRRHAPATVKALQLIGGHADYFRTRAAFCNDRGQSNLQITMSEIWQFINTIN